MGTDYRPAHPGNRTDAMMVVSIDPTTGKSAGFSVPRDISDFPLPKSGKYGPKVNGLYQHLDATMGNGGKGMKQAFARAFDIEIDHYVLIGFNGVMKLVRNVGGVDVTLAEPYYDPYYWVNNRTRGWGLPAGKSHLERRGRLDLRPQPQGRQRLPARQAAAAAGDGGRRQGPEARHRRPAASC